MKSRPSPPPPGPVNSPPVVEPKSKMLHQFSVVSIVYQASNVASVRLEMIPFGKSTYDAVVLEPPGRLNWLAFADEPAPRTVPFAPLTESMIVRPVALP